MLKQHTGTTTSATTDKKHDTMMHCSNTTVFSRQYANCKVATPLHVADSMPLAMYAEQFHITETDGKTKVSEVTLT